MHNPVEDSDANFPFNTEYTNVQIHAAGRMQLYSFIRKPRLFLNEALGRVSFTNPLVAGLLIALLK